MSNNDNLDDLNFNIGISTNSNKEAEKEKKEQPEVEEKPQISNVASLIKSSSHPWIAFFTILFKLISLISFIFLDLFWSSHAQVYLIVIISAAFDFWTIKNLSGRLLVGLRWWNKVKKDGSEVWVFESYEDCNVIKREAVCQR